MSVEFDDQKFNNVNRYKSIKKTGYKEFLIDKGLVKNEEQANYVLIGVIIISIILSIFLFSTSGNNQENQSIKFVPAEISN